MTAVPTYNLLITDDDPVARETLRELFEPAGFQTFLAESGEEAIDLAHEHDVHIALMDMHLPRLSGLETLAIVRQFKGGLPAILLSADRDDWLMRQALLAQIDCVLSKPVAAGVVIHVVRKTIVKHYQAN